MRSILEMLVFTSADPPKSRTETSENEFKVRPSIFVSAKLESFKRVFFVLEFYMDFFLIQKTFQGSWTGGLEVLGRKIVCTHL